MTLEEQISAVKQRLIDYHIQLCVTCILQDADVGDWGSNSPFQEVWYKLCMR